MDAGRTDSRAAVVGEMAGGFWAGETLDMVEGIGENVRN